MATDIRTIAATLTAGALGDQAHALQEDGTRDDASRWIVAAYRAILRELEETEPEEERKNVGFSVR